MKLTVSLILISFFVALVGSAMEQGLTWRTYRITFENGLQVKFRTGQKWSKKEVKKDAERIIKTGQIVSKHVGNDNLIISTIESRSYNKKKDQDLPFFYPQFPKKKPGINSSTVKSKKSKKSHREKIL